MRLVLFSNFTGSTVIWSWRELAFLETEPRIRRMLAENRAALPRKKTKQNKTRQNKKQNKTKTKTNKNKKQKQKNKTLPVGWKMF